MKALVLSGGSGTRLRPFSHSMPKQLIPVANRPILGHVIDSVRELGVTSVAVVVGDRAEDVRAALGNGSSHGVDITYIRQDAPRGLAHCVRIARRFLGDDDFVMYLGDNLLIGGLAEIAERFRSERPDAYLTLRKVNDPHQFGVAETDSGGRVRNLVEKPEHPVSDLAVVGVYFFTAAVHEAVDVIAPSARGELEITDAIQWLVDRGGDVRAGVHQGFWRDTGRVADVLDCNRELLATLAPQILGAVDTDSRVSGPVVVGEGARVTRSRLTGPAVIGAGSVVSDSVVGPFTSVGDGCVLERAGVQDSIVLEGAAVHGVDGVHGSVIGRRASVTDAPVTGRRTLLIGDDGRVEVSG
ncbi:glucose-1-phosphate thymidylyltransferase [Nocardiopsis arvandica]|uniref:Glucose-1-phosphate thymidylyltransferase n=1 Tax=Nocardiopsis sinuspersici TaxID=501010 RepID=A0A7Y9XH59_9ACTN|nr:glucose-1-phosphate thymidylyltransferase [Nocardiopsis sinuspersici]NYH55679.1 glucose-1-phosphate thymidylyltransferase [Nocardiopsis sinuspersici]